MHSNAKKDLYINFQKRASIFSKSILITINGGGHGRFFVLPTRLCDTKNNVFPIEDRYICLKFQHSLANILNVSQRFITNQRNHTYLLVGFLTDIMGVNKLMIKLMLFFVN